MAAAFELQVLVCEPRSGGAPGRCLELQPLEDKMLAAVVFEPAEAPLLALGRKVELQFRSLEGLTVDVEALTVLRTDEPAGRSYGFRCDLSKRLFLHLLNRRRAPRARLAPSQSMPVRLLEPGAGFEGVLYDVSSVGLSILVDAEVERELSARSSLHLALRLPGDEQALELGAVIRRRSLLGAGVLYGLELDAATTSSVAKQRFESYVDALLQAHAPAHFVERAAPAPSGS